MDDAFCAKTRTDTLECLKICASQDDCPSDAECSGTTGSNKVCRPNP